jgi:hypothetical protein
MTKLQQLARNGVGELAYVVEHSENALPIKARAKNERQLHRFIAPRGTSVPVPQACGGSPRNRTWS